MDRSSFNSTPDSEEKLVAVLATLRVTPTEEADFESRFLSEFHERVAREAVCCPARRHLLAHVMQVLQNFGRGRLAFGASALGVGGLVVCFALYPTGNGRADTAASVKAENHFSPLVLPVLSNDLEACTSVRVEPNRSTFEVGGITVTRGQRSTVIEVPNEALLPAVQRPVNYTPLPAPSVRFAF